MMMFSACTKRLTARSVAIGVAGAVLSLSSLSALAFKEPDKIISGSDMTFFPYEYMDNNQPAGFDVEFLAGLAKVMGREAVNVDTRWANLIPGLRGGRFDIINSSMYITAERMKVIDMIPYLKSGESILSVKGSEYQPKVPEDFCGHTVGSMASTSWLKQLQKLSVNYCEANGLDPIAIREYPTDPQTTQAMLSNAVEAQITDAAVARGVIDKVGNRVVISSNTLIYPVLNGFGIKKGNDEVKDALIKGLETFSKTPEYDALLKKYNFQAPAAADIEALMPKS
ncbi:transporter substrate-binding domain-containing protein [Amphritea sp. 1_MG-2023]|uniref:transporter substrate-binding domain-containing protein n=1 Tax=Amphritea sp. 1_MG-2023 TaxID=3062670 RepID=UPI0026E2A1FB|nr:transporter substrate-binding domain-containing protein [Amphritea sp. 1_MG-2023]MDO6563218.1 transporter substrate-binding domain-containing protein [Amphritea sp. 1_MG-2023]